MRGSREGDSGFRYLADFDSLGSLPLTMLAHRSAGNDSSAYGSSSESQYR